MANRILNLITDETRYRGLTRVAFHGLLIVGVVLLTISAYLPWFLYPASPLDLPFKTYAGPILRDSFCVIVQYYMLVYLVKHYSRKPLVLVPGLAAYYFVIFTCYYYTSYLVKHYFGLPDDYTGSINHFEKLSFGEALFQMAELQYKQTDYLSARGFLERYNEVGRTNAASLWLGVRIERGLGNVAAAKTYAERLKLEYPRAAQTKELIESERNPG